MLLRHRRGTAPATSAGFRRFSHLVLHEQADVTCHLAQAAGQDPARAYNYRKTVSVRVPGSIREIQSEPLGKQFSHARTAIPERSERARCSAELKNESICDRALKSSLSAAN